MSYATLQDLTNRYGADVLISFTDRGPSATGAIDQDAVARALADTDAVIDGFLGGVYALPLAEVPPLVVDLAQTIAIYKLCRFSPDQKIKDDYDGAMKALAQIAAGTIKLPVAGIEPAAKQSSGVTVTDRERPFTEDNLRGFI